MSKKAGHGQAGPISPRFQGRREREEAWRRIAAGVGGIVPLALKCRIQSLNRL